MMNFDDDATRQLLDLLPDGVLAIDELQQIQFANLKVEGLLGYARSELIGLSLDHLLAPEERERHQKRVAEFFSSDGRHLMGSGVDVQVIRRDGVSIPIDVSLASAMGPRGPVVLGLLRDAAAFAEVKTALRLSETKYRLLVENASEIFYEVSLAEDPLSGAVKFVSHGCEAITGHTPDEFISQRNLWIECVNPEDRATLFESTAAILASGAPGSRSYRIRHARTGEYAWVEDRVIPRFDAAGRMVGYQGVARDVSERRRAEAARLRLELALRQAQKMEAIGRLAGGIAHDFNNIITVVLGHAEAALAAVDPSTEVAADLNDIAKAGQRAAGLTRQLLSFARLQPAEPRLLDLNVHLREMERLLQRTAGHRIDLVLQLSGVPWSVRIDPSQVDQVVINLAANAADAMADGGLLTIRTMNATLDRDRSVGAGCQPGDYVALAVCDTGCGMDASTLSHVFEPFFTTKPAGKGTGLGLATVYGVAQQNGGGVEVQSELGHGTTVTVYLPRSSSPEC